MPTVAYLGPEHTNTHRAALSRFGRRSQYRHAPTVEEVFRLVERWQADYGVVPIENSLGGSVTHTLDRYIECRDTPVRIHGEIDLPIQHSVIVRSGATLSDVRVLYSHPQAFEQCRAWLARHLPKASRAETDSTAEAVQRLLSVRIGRWTSVWPLKHRAAIAPPELAQAHGLKAVAIPQERENRTRFLVLGLNEPPRATRSRTSLLFGLKDKPGALHDALVPFKRYGINLTKIESRPSKKRVWEYVFFIDFLGHEHDAKAQRALAALRARAAFVRVLGSYPIGN